jgi:hypothetical protein
MTDQAHEQKSGPDAPSLVVTPQPTVARSKALELAASLLDATGTGADETRDEMASLPAVRPNKAQFFRTHPTLHGDVNLLKVDGLNGTELYAVVPGMVQHIDNVNLYTLFFGVHRDGSYFLWPISATSADGYSRSARQIAISAMQHWCRLVPNRATSVYIKRVAPHCQDLPLWPEEKSFTDLLVLAFGDGRIIDSNDHPVVKEMWLK